MWQVGLQVDDELDGVMAPSSDAVPRTTRNVADVGDDHEVPCLTMDRAVQSLWTASKRLLRQSLSYTVTHAATYDCFQRSNWQSPSFLSSSMSDANANASC
jgi:hypothetical protein